jgi:hypothetical protein
MDPKKIIHNLAKTQEVIRMLAGGVTGEEARWRPSEKKWSVLEVVNHLYDEERDDFRKRLDLLLHHPGKSWPGNDPESWVTEREYNKRDPEESLQNFLAERQQSLSWLESLENPDWELRYDHPIFGGISAGTMLVSWAGHDLLHLRQIANIRYQYLNVAGEPYSTRYAEP